MTAAERVQPAAGRSPRPAAAPWAPPGARSRAQCHAASRASRLIRADDGLKQLAPARREPVEHHLAVPSALGQAESSQRADVMRDQVLSPLGHPGEVAYAQLVGGG